MECHSKKTGQKTQRKFMLNLQDSYRDRWNMVTAEGKGRYNATIKNIYVTVTVKNVTAQQKQLQKVTVESPETIYTGLYTNQL